MDCTDHFWPWVPSLYGNERRGPRPGRRRNNTSTNCQESQRGASPAGCPSSTYRALQRSTVSVPYCRSHLNADAHGSNRTPAQACRRAPSTGYSAACFDIKETQAPCLLIPSASQTINEHLRAHVYPFCKLTRNGHSYLRTRGRRLRMPTSSRVGS